MEYNTFNLIPIDLFTPFLPSLKRLPNSHYSFHDLHANSSRAGCHVGCNASNGGHRADQISCGLNESADKTENSWSIYLYFFKSK